jgi:uncharacterized protein YbbC (DUF1343 family)
MANHPYFRRTPPKSGGKELFNETFIPPVLKDRLKRNPQDVISTLTYFTAFTILQSYKRFIFPKHRVREIVVSGGGAFNETLLSHLRTLFEPLKVYSIGKLGIHPQAKEPLAFAFFAWRAVRGEINHLPQGTGARKAAVLGKITPGRNFGRAILFFAVLFLAGRLCQPAFAKVLLGIDVLKKQDFSPLKGKRIGLIINHTGTDRKGNSTADGMFLARLNLVALFSPEHGIRGSEEHGKNIADGRDAKTGLPVFSLYGATRRPTEEMLKGVDVLVFDVQDIGARFYTYTTTLAYALEEAAKRKIEFVVLDRPNPVTGAIVEGETLSPEVKHFTAYLRIPVRHGLTVGEIANWHNQTAELGAKLTVIKMEGWRRNMWWDDTGIRFTPTSPNIRNLRAAALYSGIGAFEATNVSVGRGTKEPFEVFGAPWINGKVLAEKLNFLGLEGVRFKPLNFTPEDDLYKGESCGGVKISIADRDKIRPVDVFIHSFVILADLYPEKFAARWDEIERVTGSGNLKKMIEMRQSAEAILVLVHEKAREFERARKPFLLYDFDEEKER